MHCSCGCEQVGYGLTMDMGAVAAALGGEGGSCVAVVSPTIEAGVLHRTLYAKHTPGVARVCKPLCSHRLCAVPVFHAM